MQYCSFSSNSLIPLLCLNEEFTMLSSALLLLSVLAVQGESQEKSIYNSQPLRSSNIHNHQLHSYVFNNRQVLQAMRRHQEGLNSHRTNERNRRKNGPQQVSIRPANYRVVNVNNRHTVNSHNQASQLQSNLNRHSANQQIHSNRPKSQIPNNRAHKNQKVNSQNSNIRNNIRQPTQPSRNGQKVRTNAFPQNSAQSIPSVSNIRKQPTRQQSGNSQNLRPVRNTIPNPNSIAGFGIQSNPFARPEIDNSLELDYWNLQPQNSFGIVNNQPTSPRPTKADQHRALLWTYKGPFGFSQWGERFSECQGNAQSPINIAPHFALQGDFGPLIFVNYHNIAESAMVSNNGHSVQVDITAAKTPRIFGGGLPGHYLLVQYHLHWGHNDLRGSEHTINHVRYPMELHLVHFKAEYGSVERALKYADGIAVLAILFEVSRTDNPALAPLVKKLPNITRPGSFVNTTSMYPVVTILPRDLKLFYRYSGSLTTPTCNEAVIWTVFDQAIPISQFQLSAFRNVLLDDSGTVLRDNFRPVQPLNNRKIYRSTNLAGPRSVSRNNRNTRVSLALPNTSINPNINPRINPNINPRINPNTSRNTNINPNINPRINPNTSRNTNINPNTSRNTNINPNFNLRINPNINRNTNINPNINPNLNTSLNNRVSFIFANPNVSPITNPSSNINRNNQVPRVTANRISNANLNNPALNPNLVNRFSLPNTNLNRRYSNLNPNNNINNFSGNNLNSARSVISSINSTMVNQVNRQFTDAQQPQPAVLTGNFPGIPRN